MRSGSVISGEAIELTFERTLKRERGYQGYDLAPWGNVMLAAHFVVLIILIFSGVSDVFTRDSIIRDECLYRARGRSYGFGVLAAYSCLFLMNGIWCAFALRRHYSTYPISTQFRMRIGPDGVSTADSTSTATYTWEGLQRIVRARSDRLLNFASGHVVPIPADALPDGMTMDDVLGRIEAWRAAAPPPVA